MSDDFEAQLGRMFAQAPGLPDNDAFAGRVASRLDRSWALRRIMIAVGGLASGVVVAWQFVAGRLETDMGAASRDAAGWFGRNYAEAFSGIERLMSSQAGGETIWFGAALAAVALAFATTRLVENL